MACLSGFEEAEELATAETIVKYGGEIRTELTSEVTHLIAVALCGSKVRQIMKKGLNDRSQYLVSPLWLEKSVAGGAREVETEHVAAEHHHLAAVGKGVAHLARITVG